MSKKLDESVTKEKEVIEVKNRMPGWAIVLTTIASVIVFWWVIFFVGFVIGFMSYDGWWGDSSNDPVEIVIQNNIIYINEGEFTIDKSTLQIEFNERSNVYVLTGIIKNELCDNDMRLWLTFALFDEDDNIIDTVDAEIRSLNMGETWRFRAHSLNDIDGDKVYRFELRYVEIFNWHW